MAFTVNSKCHLKSELHEKCGSVMEYGAAADLHAAVTDVLWYLANRMWIMQFKVSCINYAFRCWKRSSSSRVVHIKTHTSVHTPSTSISAAATLKQPAVTHTFWTFHAPVCQSENTALMMSQQRGTRSVGERPACTYAHIHT